MQFSKEIIKAVSKGEKLELIKQLKPDQALKLGLLVRKYKQESK
ncbi:hypothetical protein [Bacillus sp. CGMCC 1.16541]|nr:hypothetical protein [Bacillus sp. CGMCC 1.16541]